MQNKYFGDIHDFYKFYFLKEITKDYSLGIHWCLYPNELENNEGNKSLTLKEKNKDLKLYELLIKYRHKGVKYIKPYFPKKTKYYEQELDNNIDNKIYEEEAIKILKYQDIIFFDPDTGIEVPSMKKSEKYKYITYELILKFWNMGKSLIIYQHTRGNNVKTNEKVKKIYDLLNQMVNIILVKKSNVVYICLIQGDKHFIVKDELMKFIQNKEYKIENWEGTGDIMC